MKKLKPPVPNLAEILADPGNAETFTSMVKKFIDERMDREHQVQQSRENAWFGALLIEWAVVRRDERNKMVVYEEKGLMPSFPTASTAEMADEARVAETVRHLPWLMAKAAILATLAACLLVYFTHSRPQSFIPPHVTATELPPEPVSASSITTGASASIVALTMKTWWTVAVEPEQNCWIQITPDYVPGAGAQPFFEGTVVGGHAVERRFNLDERVLVRSGCPGRIRYLVDGTEVHPKNLSDHEPPIVELVSLP